jgi:hypothetical protein
MMADFKTTNEKIKQRSYWKVEFFPSTFKESAISGLSDSKAVISDSAVLLRGWDYPHVPTQGDEKQDIYPKDNDRYESWIDWSIHKEVWRFYKSGKYIQLRGLFEQWYDQYEVFLAPNPLSKLEPNSVVDIIEVVYTLTEVFLFLYNLAGHMREIDSFELRISMCNVEGKKLVVLDPARAPLHWQPVSHSGEITVVKSTLHKADLMDKEQMLKLARQASQTVFENFEWQANESLLEELQKKLQSRSL